MITLKKLTDIDIEQTEPKQQQPHKNFFLLNALVCRRIDIGHLSIISFDILPRNVGILIANNLSIAYMRYDRFRITHLSGSI